MQSLYYTSNFLNVYMCVRLTGHLPQRSQHTTWSHSLVQLARTRTEHLEPYRTTHEPANLGDDHAVRMVTFLHQPHFHVFLLMLRSSTRFLSQYNYCPTHLGFLCRNCHIMILYKVATYSCSPEPLHTLFFRVVQSPRTSSNLLEPLQCRESKVCRSL